MVWYLKQLLPLAYWTVYGDGEGRSHLVIWRMWFGRSFDICDILIPDQAEIVALHSRKAA